MRIHAINAFEGDCLLLEDDTSASYALLDGGPRGTFDAHLGAYLRHVIGADGTLEAVIVSHVDADHIAGVLDLLADIERGRADGDGSSIRVTDLWHNSFSRTLDDAGGSLQSNLQAMMSLAGRAKTFAANSSIAFLGISQGARLRRLALKLGIPINAAFAGGLISQDEQAGVSWALGQASFTVVGPTADNLRELREKWVEWIEQNLDAFAQGDTAAMANADKSVPNLSSIVLLGTTPHGDVLLTGDARGDHILQGLEQSGELAPGGSRHFRLVKLQHHGSIRNVEQDFFERLTADVYLVSADGKHGNPDLAALTLLVDVAHAAGRQPLVVVTNEPPSVVQLRADRPPVQFNYELEVRDPQKDSVIVDLATGKVA